MQAIPGTPHSLSARKHIAMKISIVTAVFNRAHCIADAIASVQRQRGVDLEYVIIDGASTDGTLDILKACLDQRAILVSEPDNGIYDALNKGFARAGGDIVGVMHSDDFYADDEVLERVAAAFSDPEVDAVYGDLDYVAQQDSNRIIRRWRSQKYSPQRLAWGWMPPHPTLFIRRSVLEQWGLFDTSYRIAADYDFILRYFSTAKVRALHIPSVLVKMRTGGVSNKSLPKIFTKSMEDFRAIRSNHVGGIGTLVWKNLGKLTQFFSRSSPN